MTAQSVSRGNLIGIASLNVGIFIFSIQDAILKGLSGEHAVTLAMVIRSLIGLPILFAMVHFECGLGRLKSRNWRPLLLRGAILLVSYTDRKSVV